MVTCVGYVTLETRGLVSLATGRYTLRQTSIPRPTYALMISCLDVLVIVITAINTVRIYWPRWT